jgi:moderate conductance mechanosensitive channel
MDEMLAYLRELDAGAMAATTMLLRIVVIVTIAWVLQGLAARLIRIFRGYMQGRTAGDESRRIETLATVFRYVAVVVIALIAGSLVLDELGISVAPLLATAGVAGVAIGFGAQSLIKDYFNGFFLLLEDQVRQGDVVEVSGKGGFVEEVTLRYVRLRDFEGHVHYVPNGEIKIVTNRTREFATAVMEVGIAYREDVDEALAVMREVGQAMRADPAWAARIVADTEIIGLDRMDSSSVALRCRLRVVPAIEQWNVRREYLKRLKKAFDERDIEIPFPHLTLYPGQRKDGAAPPLHLLAQKR